MPKTKQTNKVTPLEAGGDCELRTFQTLQRWSGARSGATRGNTTLLCLQPVCCAVYTVNGLASFQIRFCHQMSFGGELTETHCVFRAV